MEGIDDGSVDVIIFNWVLHYISGTDVKSSLETLDRVLEASRRKLRLGGHLVIAETLLPECLYCLQNLFFKLERWILGSFQVPMIYFFSRPVLAAYVAEKLELEPNGQGVD